MHGILELDNSIGELTLGKELKDYHLLNDDIIEIELTANRGDCLSINGVARELAAYYNLRMIEQDFTVEHNDLGIGQILDVDASNNIDSKYIYKATDMKNFTLPVLYKVRVGILDNFKECDIQDIVTYVTHSTGVILNAYARDDFKASKTDIAKLEIKKINKGLIQF